jgi:ankyrin repeat protein
MNCTAGFSLIHLACRNDDVEFLKSLLATGADPNTCNRKNQSCLHICAKYGSEECLKVLIFARANLDAFDYRRRTPLYVCSRISGNYSGCLEILLKAGADPNIPDVDGNTPLHRACFVGRGKYVRKLLEYGANPNICNAEGNTPLHLAVDELRLNSEKTLKALLEAGANVRFRNSLGDSPLEIAQRSHILYAELLLSYSSKEKK